MQGRLSCVAFQTLKVNTRSNGLCLRRHELEKLLSSQFTATGRSMPSRPFPSFDRVLRSLRCIISQPSDTSILSTYTLPGDTIWSCPVWSLVFSLTSLPISIWNPTYLIACSQHRIYPLSISPSILHLTNPYHQSSASLNLLRSHQKVSSWIQLHLILRERKKKSNGQEQIPRRSLSTTAFVILQDCFFGRNLPFGTCLRYRYRSSYKNEMVPW